MMMLAGVFGLVLSGDSLGRACRHKNLKLLLFGVFELSAGLYFLVAAIGHLST
ncbi:MAG: hypothetical protein ACTSV7_00570 [Candidatus Baldrarchaeia archaeon]